MKILFDEGVPVAIRKHLPQEQVDTLQEQGWEGIQNGKLLQLVQDGSYDVFVTADKNMSSQQTLINRPFAVLVLSTNHWPTISGHVASIADALSNATLGQVTHVDCGLFPPKSKTRQNEMME